MWSSIFAATMILTDTHIHLYAEEFETATNALIDAAIAQDIKRFFLPNIDSTSIDGLFKITEQYPESCFAMLGLHPCYVKENFQEELTKIHSAITSSVSAAGKSKNIYAVGEIGLDFYWDKTFTREQELAFITQCHWADELELPVVIHSRNSTTELITILKNHPHLNLTGIFHCFSGTLEQAKEIIDMGFYLGIGGAVTFKNSGIDKVVEQVDLKHIVIETDGPYLAPVPHRGKTNLPVYLKLVAEKIAAIKNVSVEDVAQITTENSKRIFKI